MNHIKTYENWFKKKVTPQIKKLNPKNDPDNHFTKSDYTFEEEAESRIDPSSMVTIKSWMKCPVCGTEMEDMAHGEIRKCSNCKTKMQVFGNSLRINVIEPDPFHLTAEVDVDYSNNRTKEKLLRSDYVRGNQMECPLCHKILDAIDHGETKICPECGLKMINYGNGLSCEIDNDKLEFYKNVRNYNL